MSIPSDAGVISMKITPLIDWFQVNVFHPAVFVELSAIVVAYLLAQQIAKRLRQHFDETIQKAQDPGKLHVKLEYFCTIVKYFFTLLLLWPCYIVVNRSGMPTAILVLTFYLVLAMLTFRFAFWYVKSTFWSRFVFITCLLFIVLQGIGTWTPALHLFDDMSLKLGHVNISLLSGARTLLTFFLLWSIAIFASHYFSFLLESSTRLNYSDRRHIERIIKFILMVLVAMITLATAGIHPAALSVFGGAAGFAIGVGLQKIGSNVISGIALMIRKPINQGDVLLMAGESGNTMRSVVVKEIGLIYIHVYSRDGTIELIPNESFVTQKIVNASLPVKPIRIRIPFGISYSSDLQQAMTLALEAVQSVERILPTPAPVCQLIELGDSTVGLELRVWINDPENGLSNVKSFVLLAVWDIFRANHIEFAFPQRDLHIKSAVPLGVTGS
jgi:small-conductance mechanosensitive channel